MSKINQTMGFFAFLTGAAGVALAVYYLRRSRSNTPRSKKAKDRLQFAMSAVASASRLSPVCLPKGTAAQALHKIAAIAIVTMPLIELAYDGYHLPDTLAAACSGGTVLHLTVG